MMEDHKGHWWGYLHVNGEIKTKAYYSETQLEDAYSSPFVQTVVPPRGFIGGREEAEEYMRKRLQKYGKKINPFA